MSALNIVRLRVKPGLEEQFLEAHRQVNTGEFNGFRKGWLVKTGDRSYCMVGEWDDYSSIESSRDAMIRVLDGIRDLLEDLGNGMGVTDPVSGEVVVEL